MVSVACGRPASSDIGDNFKNCSALGTLYPLRLMVNGRRFSSKQL
jgi:hypothetical protein